ncbi:hypothetical protein MBT84_43695 [Streptomyces sp. MBT84]|nr:hypothetical protein [Streptomyces sp. MBT84]
MPRDTESEQHVEELAVGVSLSSLPVPTIPPWITAVAQPPWCGARDTRAALPSAKDVLVLQNDAVPLLDEESADHESEPSAGTGDEYACHVRHLPSSPPGASKTSPRTAIPHYGGVLSP